MVSASGRLLVTPPDRVGVWRVVVTQGAGLEEAELEGRGLKRRVSIGRGLWAGFKEAWLAGGAGLSGRRLSPRLSPSAGAAHLRTILGRPGGGRPGHRHDR